MTIFGADQYFKM